MEPVLIYTDAAHVDAGAIQTFEMDLAFGADEQNFEIAFPEPTLSGGELLYIDGTEYGGIVDEITKSTETDNVIYKGRTWHGMFAGKIVKPPSNADYYVLSGDANACIASLLTKVGLTDVLTARSTSAGISVNYQFERFCNAYDGLLKMLSSANAVLRIERHDGITELWAEPRVTITDEADSDIIDFALTDSIRVPNHLVCAGEGELQERVVVDLYADTAGNVSQTQTQFGVDEIAVLYNYNNADSEKLVEDGTKELRVYQQGGGADLQVNNKGDWHVGDSIQVRDNNSGLVITSTIAKKIVKVKDGVLSVDYEIGNASAQSYKGDMSAEMPMALPLTGGTLTGDLLVDSHRVKTLAGSIERGNPGSSTIYGGSSGFQVCDKDGKQIGYIQPVQYSDGRETMQMGVSSYGGSSTDYNTIEMGFDSNGNKIYSVGSASAFRNAIGIGGAYGTYFGVASTLSLTTTAQKVALKTFNGVNCSASSNGIKIAQAGTYLVWVGTGAASGFTAGDRVHVRLYKNSTFTGYEAAALVHAAAAWIPVANGPFIVSCAVNDVLYTYAYNESGSRGQVANSTQADSCGLAIIRIA